MNLESIRVYVSSVDFGVFLIIGAPAQLRCSVCNSDFSEAKDESKSLVFFGVSHVILLMEEKLILHLCRLKVLPLSFLCSLV